MNLNHLRWEQLTENQQLTAEAIYIQVCEEQDCVPVADWWEDLSDAEQAEVIEGVAL